MIVFKGGKFIVVPDDELYHHGVLGQKWGVRRYQNKDGSLTAAGRRKREQKTQKELRKEAVRDQKAMVKNRSTMTNAELKEQIERLKLEKELRTLTQEEMSPGRIVLDKAIKDAGSQVLTSALAGAGRYAMLAAADRQFSIPDLLKSMATGNAQSTAAKKAKSNLERLKDDLEALRVKNDYDAQIDRMNKRSERLKKEAEEKEQTEKKKKEED